VLAAGQSPAFNRFSKIMRESEITALRKPDATLAKWKGTATDYSVGTRSIQLNDDDAATRTLGLAAAQQLVPITKDPAELFKAKKNLYGELAKKQGKTPFDQALEDELRRSTNAIPGKFAHERDVRAMDWPRIDRATTQ
jgi:hypothetical protein